MYAWEYTQEEGMDGVKYYDTRGKNIVEAENMKKNKSKNEIVRQTSLVTDREIDTHIA